MKHFFMKKYIFAVVFVLILFGFGIINFIHQSDALGATISKYSKFTEKNDIKKLITKVTDTINAELLGKIPLIETYGYLQELMGKGEINNFSFIRDKNGFLNYAGFFQKDDAQLMEYAKRVRRLKESLEKKGTKVLFINPPDKHVPGFSQFDDGFPVHDTNPLQDEFLMYLQSNGVDVLDLREPILESGLPYEKLFYKTDHHWTVEAAFIAFSAIVDDMESRYGLQLDPDGFYRDLDQYSTYFYPKSMLGSMGRNTGINYSGLDDFTLITPNFETDLTWEAEDLDGGKKKKTGSFEKSILQLNNLSSSSTYKVSKYDTYIETINPWDKITNHKNPDGPKILCIRDSFFSPTLSFLAPLVGQIHMIWPLATSHSTNIEEYLEYHEFDYVFVELYPSNIKDEGFPYFKSEGAK